MFIADPARKPTDVFMYTLRATRVTMLTEGPTEVERALAAQHWAYSQGLLARRAMIFAGRTLVTTADAFAVAVIQASSEAEARAVMDADPAVRGGLFRAELFPFQPMLVGAWPPGT